MGTIDDQAHEVMSAALAYVEAWKALQLASPQADLRKALADRRSNKEKKLRDAVEALLST